tara:strand:+ start:718 stop:1194 length:477 start_codon:yes stop_codon:yes gene_type:complete
MTDGSSLKWGRFCKTCGRHYTELKTIGKWSCSYHPLPVLKNGEGTVLSKYPDGCFACCGVSPHPFLPNGHRNPNFNSSKLKGCCAKDCSGIQMHFSDADNIPYSAWPENLRIEMDKDIQKLLKGQTNHVHVGIKIDKHNELFIQRYDKEKHNEILKNK